MANRIGVAPKNSDILKEVPSNDLWFKTVESRLNIYSGSSDPTASDVPDGQWLLWRNTTTGAISLWSNYNGTVTSIGTIGPNIAVSGSITSSGGGIGYATGAGGTVTQLTNKTTGVTLNKLCGQITMAFGNLTSHATASFTFTNSFIAAGDLLILNHVSGGTAGAYAFNAQCTGGSALISINNLSSGGLNEQPVIGFAVIKAVTS
jgi:hypothetical protein